MTASYLAMFTLRSISLGQIFSPWESARDELGDTGIELSFGNL
jgi:hypothetical protein